MQLRKNNFKRALKKRQVQIGLWSILGNNQIAEMLTHAGYDWIVVDTEHSPNEVPDVLLQLQIIQPGKAEPMVRVAWNDAVLIKRLLDIGTQTLLVPFVQNAEQAKAAVAATRYPPAGIRGVMSSARMNHFNKIKDYYANAHKEMCVAVQTETIEAIENIPAIAKVNGVDGIFIGPSDLAASMGHIGNPTHKEVQAAIRRGMESAHKGGKPAGILSASEQDVQRYLEWGFDFVAIGSDLGLITNTATALCSRVKEFSSKVKK